MHWWCGDSCPAWSPLHECQHRFFYPNTKRVTRWQHRSTGVGKAPYIRWNLCRGKRKENKTSGHWKWRDRRGLFSAFWPGWWEEITSVASGADWNQYLIKGLDKVHDGISNLSTSALNVTTELLFHKLSCNPEKYILVSFFFLFYWSCNLVCVSVCACVCAAFVCSNHPVWNNREK